LSDSRSHFHLLLALERRPDSSAVGKALARPDAEELVAVLAKDLARLFPEIEGLDLVCSAACYDPAELLRPEWPVHRSLGQLAEISPGAEGRLIAFVQHEGAFADSMLAPDPALAGGPLQVMPLLLVGDDARIAILGARMEAELLERGMAGAEAALQAQALLALPLEHARYMSLNDLCAMTAMQYQHVGLEAVWHLIEAALFGAPDAVFVEGVDLPPLLLTSAGEVCIGAHEFAAWCERFGAGLDADGLARRFGLWQARLRQIEAVLASHGIPTQRVALGENDDAERRLRSAFVRRNLSEHRSHCRSTPL
jgi:hypothetical protein